MPAMPDIIAKPPFMQKLDQAALAGIKSGDPVAFFNQSVAAFQSAKSLIDICRDYGLTAANSVEKKHLGRDWFDPTNGWWKQHQPIEPIVRGALIKAAELMRDLGIPVVHYWVCTGPTDGGVFEISLSKTDRQITMLIHTPIPPTQAQGYYQAQAEEPDMWLVLREGGSVVTRHVSKDDASGV